MSVLKGSNNLLSVYNAAVLKHILLLLLLGILCTGNLYAQNKKQELEEKKRQLQKEIEYKNKLLDEVKSSKNKSMAQLAILNNKIQDQENLINILNNEVTVLNTQIVDVRTVITKKELELKQLKEDYARMVLNAYKNKNSYDRLTYIFAAKDLNQAFLRARYFQEYGTYRQKQLEEIEGKKKELNVKLQELQDKKVEQNNLLTDKEKEKVNLAQQKNGKEQMLNDLRQKERNLKEEVKERKRMAEKIKRAIDKLIAEEIERNNRRIAMAEAAKKAEAAKNNKAANTKTPKENETKSSGMKLSEQDMVLSNRFEDNQGKLPWPLTQGVITERFGKHEHPELKGIEINSNGVQITTTKGSEARAIFDGEVAAVAEVGGLDGKVVLIRHGEYLSVYYTLQNVNVKTGDKVKTKQQLGTVVTDDNNKTELHLEIYKGKSLLNPENWIVNRR